jgi:hypothetical protein
MPTTPLLKNIDNWIRTNQMMGQVNNVNNYSFQKVPLTEIYKKAAPVNRGVENSNQKVANVMQNANSLPIQKVLGGSSSFFVNDDVYVADECTAENGTTCEQEHGSATKQQSPPVAKGLRINFVEVRQPIVHQIIVLIVV